MFWTGEGKVNIGSKSVILHTPKAKLSIRIVDKLQFKSNMKFLHKLFQFFVSMNLNEKNIFFVSKPQ